MWEKEVTEELIGLYDEYLNAFGTYPEGYIELNYDAMTYDRFVGYIRESLRTGKELPYVVPF